MGYNILPRLVRAALHFVESPLWTRADNRVSVLCMLACLFPGQGSQSPGMGRAIADAHEVARRTFEEADEALETSLSKVVFEGSEDELKRTEVTQPAILTTSVATWRVLQQEAGLVPTHAAGHSLGEWSALVAVGALAFADAVRLVRERGRFMQEAVPEGEGAMLAVIGLDADAVEAVCGQARERVGDGAVVSPANMNSPEQIVISGSRAAVEAAADLCKEAGAKKVVPLPVSAPFHCALMQPAADRLSQVLAGVSVSSFSCPVVSNVEAVAYADPSRTKQLLVQQVTAPVRWTESVTWIRSQGVEQAIEVGPGKVLMGLNRRIDRSLSTHTTDTLDKLQATLEALG